MSTEPTIGKEQNWSWVYQLLPYLDQDNLWRSPNSDDGDAVVLRTAVTVLSCPSRRAATVWLCDNDVLAGHPNWPSSSVSVEGVDKRLQFLIDYAGNGGVLSTIANGNPTGLVVPRGSLRLTPANVRSMSNTVFVGEKYVPFVMYSGGDPGADDMSGYFTFNLNNIRFGDLGPLPDGTARATSTGVNLNFAPFGSAHPYGMNAVFGDGSVRVIRYGNPVFPLACRRDNSQAFSLDD
jgi:hypothetical protein